eukprot:gnl/Hemi2/14332_TR4861_c0_g10_i1.p1 gnl/Hemi2/14332_TR4861_c0_g10~~gnl/Hemi2/14332_TR4861_c0_g10_i1.p1  ORF type:complete len:244 (-),score=102.66 gnl/Hemi2/14332_TR4861_c0_g10_i1:202-933(-)
MLRAVSVFVVLALVALVEARTSSVADKSEVIILGNNNNAAPSGAGQIVSSGLPRPVQVVNIPMPVMEAPAPEINNICEWKLHHFEEYSHGASGWSSNEVTECDCRKILGGHCKFGGGEIHKEFTGLPQHNLLRVKANYWLLDNWSKETAFAKIEDKLVWTKGSHDNTWRGINVCGDAKYSDWINHPIDFAVVHSEGCVKLAFGSNLDGDACEKSWGISNVSIYTCSHCVDATYCPWQDQIPKQ